MVSSKRIIFIAISLAIVLMLSGIYIDYITPIFGDNVSNFGEYGYPEGRMSYINLFFVFIFMFVLSFVVPFRINSPSSIVLIIYYYVAVVPFLALFVINVTASEDDYFIEFFNIFIFYIIAYVFASKNIILKSNNILKSNEVNKKRLKLFSFVIFTISLLLISYLYISYAKGTSISLANLLDVYGQREVFSEKSGFIGQIISSYVIYGVVPFFVFGYKFFDNKMFLILSIFMGVITFLATGSKLFLGSVFLIILVMKYYKNNISHSVVGLFLLSLITLSYGLSVFFGFHMMLSLFVRRMLVVPAQLFALFHQHAQENGFNYLSRYTSFITGSDGISIAHSIGNKYYRYDSSANSGIIPDAYGNFGVLGVVFYAFFFVVIFKYIDKLNLQSNLLITPLFAGLAISLTNSSLLAVFIYQILMLIITFKLFNFINRVKLA